MAARFATVDALPDPTAKELQTAIAAAKGGVVYFIQHGEAGPVKIGYTTATGLKARIAAMQTGNPVKLILRRVCPGTRQTENLLHQLFADLRVTGEWFWPTSDLARVAWTEPVADPGA
jgi:hypothetical protein